MAEKATYRVREWEKHFECSQTRKVVGALKWLALPVRHDGASFRRLMRRQDGMAVFAAWVLILQVAAKCHQRGVLIGDHGPIDAEEMSLVTDAPAATFQLAFEVLSSPEIGWLDVSKPSSRHRLPPSATAVADSGTAKPPSATAVADSGSPEPQPATTVDYIQTDIHTDKQGKGAKSNDVPIASQAKGISLAPTAFDPSIPADTPLLLKEAQQTLLNLRAKHAEDELLALGEHPEQNLRGMQ